MTPIAGAGNPAAAPWQEHLVAAGLMSSAAAMLSAAVIALWGLRGEAEPIK